MWPGFNGQSTIVQQWTQAYSGNIVLLVKGDGSVTDASVYGRAMTARNGASTSSSQAKFGSESMTFDGVNDYWDTPDSSDFAFGSRVWSVDFWLYIPASTTLAADNSIVSCWKTGSYGWWIGLDNASRLRFFESYDGSTGFFTTMSAAIPDDTWTHCAIWRATTGSAVVRAAVDGTIVGSRSLGGAIFDSTAKLCIGATDDPAAYTEPIFVDELRICVDTVDYGLTGFSPPTSAY